jgi:hypothetical protein
LCGATHRHSFGRVFQDVSGEHPASVGGSRWEPLRNAVGSQRGSNPTVRVSLLVSVRPAVTAIATLMSRAASAAWGAAKRRVTRRHARAQGCPTHGQCGRRRPPACRHAHLRRSGHHPRGTTAGHPLVLNRCLI